MLSYQSDMHLYQTDMLSYQTYILSYQIDMFVISILISFVFTLLHLINK